MPDKKCRFRTEKPQWMTVAIAKMIKARDKACTKKRIAEYTLLRALVQRKLRTSRREFCKYQLNDNKDTTSWWNTLKTLTNNLQQNHSPTAYTSVNGTRLNNKEFSEDINKYYVSVGEERLSGYKPGTENCTTQLQHVSIADVKLMLKMLDS